MALPRRSVLTSRPSMSATSNSGPEVSVLICSADRSEDLAAAVGSILRSQGRFVELLVVDQSRDDVAERRIMQQFAADPRLRYIRTPTRGKGISLGIGIAAARGELIAITDDDCQVSPCWPDELVAPMVRDPRVAMTYGQVLAAEHDSSKGFIPAYTLEHDRECNNLWDKLRARGIGANTGLRKSVVQALGGFDHHLGPGGRFHACEDGDLSVRALLAGHKIYETRESSVLHFGFREWSEGKRMAYRSFYGIGAAYVKPLRRGHVQALPVFLGEFMQHALIPFALAALTFRRPLGWQRVNGFCAGVLDGLRMPMDEQHLLFSDERE